MILCSIALYRYFCFKSYTKLLCFIQRTVFCIRLFLRPVPISYLSLCFLVPRHILSEIINAHACSHDLWGQWPDFKHLFHSSLKTWLYLCKIPNYRFYAVLSSAEVYKVLERITFMALFPVFWHESLKVESPFSKENWKCLFPS